MSRKFLAIAALLTGVAAIWPSGGQAGSLVGDYGFTGSGMVINASGFNGPIVIVGDFELDGHGVVTGRETFNVVGFVCSGTLAGTYTTSPEGSGTVNAPFTPTTAGCPSGTIVLSYEAVDDNDKLYFVQTDINKVVSGVAEKKKPERLPK